MRSIKVELGDRSYQIYIENGLMQRVGPYLKDLGFADKAAVITNPLVGGLYGMALTDSLKASGLKPVVITIPDGEEFKTLEVASRVFDGLIENRMERSSPIIALGGGVIGDLAGFVAATYLRGVPLIQAPTTLLSQVDSSVGGKTGVNHPKGKNLIGAFYQPRAVFIDPGVLNTLDPREARAGLAEVVKYGVIRDGELFGFLEKSTSRLVKPTEELIFAIERSCRIKAEVVGADERESGPRAILNFGHTFGHAIEALSGYGVYRHGEAVAIGMAMAARLSARLGLCKNDVPDRIESLLRALGLPVRAEGISPKSYIESMLLDKKVSASRLRFILVHEIGTVSLKEVDETSIADFLGAAIS